MPLTKQTGIFHGRDEILLRNLFEIEVVKTEYKFRIDFSIFNHYHPYTDAMTERLIKKSVPGLVDHTFVKELNDKGIGSFAKNYKPVTTNDSLSIATPYPDENMDFSDAGAYSIYNWEIFFHAPLAIAVHLSRSQRFEEAQKWFHFIFDPTSQEPGNSPLRFWRFSEFRKETSITHIKDLLATLDKPGDDPIKTRMLNSIQEWRRKPFQPHVIARTRFVAYQYNVLMKYLDNLIAWGDYFFRQEGEAIEEAIQCYTRAAGILGPRPQMVAPIKSAAAKTYAQLTANGAINAFGNKLVDLETEFPFNFLGARIDDVDVPASNVMLNAGKMYYFSIPHNEKLMKYWDVVQDRKDKIHNCLNIDGMARQLALFDPPIDPGLLVNAAARGIDMASVIGGLNQPVSLVRASYLIQKALDICNEVKSLGSQLLSTIEKKESEELSLLRQQHEIKMLGAAQDVRFLQWKEAEESTTALMRSRDMTLQRFRHYQLLTGKTEDAVNALKAISISRKEINAENFDELYAEMVGKYSGDVALQSYPKEKMDLVDLVADAAAGILNLKADTDLNLNKRENIELNVYMPVAHLLQQESAVFDTAAGLLALIPEFTVQASPMGVGAAIEIGGREFSALAAASGKVKRIMADSYSYQGSRASKLAGYQRRTEDWVLQNNLAAGELMQIGRQLIASLIREQITRKEYENHKLQAEQAEAVNTILQEKFTNKELYGWMQGEVQKLYSDCYKFAFDIAKKAEQTMKHELMREEIDRQEFISFGYWDNTKKGLLAGEKLYQGIRKMEWALQEVSRDYEKVKHISLHSLDPKALLDLKYAKSCTFNIPEWLFDMDGAGEFQRRIKTVSITIPCVAGPFTSISCKASLRKSSIRISSIATDTYESTGIEDERFRNNAGVQETIVTSNAQNDSGLFETNLGDFHYLPFEGKGVISEWRLELPEQEQFDYSTISDVILHIRYTAREGGNLLKEAANTSLKQLIKETSAPVLFRVYSVRHEFPQEWHKFQLDKPGGIKLKLESKHFPYLHNNKVKFGAIRWAGIIPDDTVQPLWQVLNVQDTELPAALAIMAADGREEDVYILVEYVLDF